MKKRIIYFCSGVGKLFNEVEKFSCLGKSKFQIEAVIADRPCKAAKLAQSKNIKTHIINYKNYPNEDLFNQDIFNVVDKYKPDFMVLNYGRLIKEPLLEKYKNRIINVHYSLLPSHKGFKGIESAINYGNKIIGVTTHFINEDFDCGPIIAQSAGGISAGDNLDVIEREQLDRAIKLTIQSCQWFAEGKIKIKNNIVQIKDVKVGKENIFSPNIDYI